MLSVSRRVAAILDKSKNYVMVSLEDQCDLMFAGTDEPAAYLELKSINLPEADTAQLSSSLCGFIHERLEIDPSRIYIEFSNAERHMWGWNGRVF